MVTPLYNELQKQELEIDKYGNCGLWFERFADFYESDFRILKKKIIDKKEENPGSAWLKKHFNNKKVGDEKRLTSHAQAQTQLAESLQGKSLVFKASWHFVTGMGNPHPVENGFAWHPTFGVPYLTGAAVKGLIRTFIETQLDETDSENPDKKKLLLQWFGSTDKDPMSEGYQAQAGELIFFDALPIEPVTLGVDIMTPHMGKWYEKGGDITDLARQPEAVPADWHDPVPVSFLVAKDITLLFSFAMRPHPTAKQEPFRQLDLTEVEQALTAVLEQMGAGGKTATGYGGMKHDAKALQNLNAIIEKQAKEREAKIRQAQENSLREAVLSQMNPIERAITEFLSVADAIKAIKSGQWSGDEQQKASQFLRIRMQQEKIWKETTTAKNPEKDKDFKRTQDIMQYLKG